MNGINKRTNRYMVIKTIIRWRLLNLIKNDGLSIKEAAEILGIKYGTAKTIMRIYRIKGTIDRTAKGENPYRYYIDIDGNVIKDTIERSNYS